MILIDVEATTSPSNFIPKVKITTFETKKITLQLLFWEAYHNFFIYKLTWSKSALFKAAASTLINLSVSGSYSGTSHV